MRKNKNKHTLRNYTEKQRFLDKIDEEGRVPNDEELRTILRLCSDKNECIRSEAASGLVYRYTPESEDVLLQMTYDKNMLVRVEAVDTLCIGHKVDTLKRLEELFQGTNYLTRGYSIASFFSVWLNCYGYNRESIAAYLAKTEKYRCKEENLWVLNDYEVNRYHAGIREGAEFLLHRLQSCDGKNLREVDSLVNCIKEIRNVWNQEWIDKGLKDSILNMPESGVAVREILGVTESFAYPQILFLDHTNTGISQVLEYLGNVKYMFQFFSAGFVLRDGIEPWVIHAVQETYGEDIRNWQYPKQQEFIQDYQFIVPLGVKIQEEQYPFHKIIRKYENMTEEQITIDQGQRMVDELVAEICKVCAGEGICLDMEDILVDE